MVTFSFIAASAALLLTPGPTNTILAARGASSCFRKASVLPLAEALGYAVAIGVFVACASLVRADPVAMAAIRLIAAGWLAFSAYRLWVEPFPRAGSGGRFIRACPVTSSRMKTGPVLVRRALVSRPNSLAQVWRISVPRTLRHSRMNAARAVQPLAETMVPST